MLLRSEPRKFKKAQTKMGAIYVSPRIVAEMFDPLLVTRRGIVNFDTPYPHIFSDSPQFQHTAPQFSQAVLSLSLCVVLPPLSIYSAQQHRKRAAAYARVEGLCIYIFGIAVLLF